MKKNKNNFLLGLLLIAIIQCIFSFVLHTTMTVSLLYMIFGVLAVGFYLLISSNDDYLKIKNYELEIKKQEIELETKKLDLKMQEINTSFIISENSKKLNDEKKGKKEE